MGNSNGHLISYDEALQRCNAAQSKCIEHWFDALTTNKGDFIQKAEFVRDTMNRFSNMPDSLCQSMYNAFDTNHTNCLIYDDFFCGIVIVLNGALEEHLVLTYKIIQELKSNPQGITLQGILELNEILNTHEGSDIRWNRKRLEQMIISIPKYKEIGYLPLNEFIEFGKMNPTCPLCTWLTRLSSLINTSFVDDQQMIYKEKDLEKPKQSSQVQTIYDSINKVPLFILMNAYTNLSHIGEQGYVTRTQWMNEISKFLRKHLAAGLFNQFTEDHEYIDVIPVISGMILLSSTQIEKRFVSSLHIYERKCTTAGEITYLELRNLLFTGLRIINVSNAVEADIGDDVVEPAQSTHINRGMSKEERVKPLSTDIKENFSIFVRFCNDIFSTVNTPYPLVSRSIEIRELLKWLAQHINDYNTLLSSLSLPPATPTQIPSTREDEQSIYEQLYIHYDEEDVYCNERYYVIDITWWDKWTRYITTDDDITDVIPERPGAINNCDILEEDQLTLKSELTEDRDYVIIQDDLWKQLYAWYGGGPVIPRRVIRTSNGELELELYPLQIDVCDCMSDGSAGITKDHIFCSKAITVEKMKERACKLFGYDPEICRIWRLGVDEEGEYLIQDENRTLEDLDFYEEQSVMIEVQKTDGEWIRENMMTLKKYKKNFIQGLTGLANLGNTCYMNASLQCLINTPLLVEYFKTNEYLYDINVDNKYGSQGKISTAFGDLISTVYETEQKVVAPRKFKAALDVFTPQFRGYLQHDAQEFLSKILDCLSEDLNRVTNKVYLSMRDSSRPDTDVANEWWNYYISREKSIITALFAGQFQSIMQCTGCEYQSVKYETFNQVQLSLPETEMRVLSLILSYSDGRLPMQCCIRVPSDADINAVSIALYGLDSALSLQGKRLMLARIENNNVVEEFGNAFRLDQSSCSQYTAFILPSEQDCLGYKEYKCWKERKPFFWIEEGVDVEVKEDGYEYDDNKPTKIYKGIIKRKINSYVYEVEREDGSRENVDLDRILDAEYLMPMVNEPIYAPLNYTSKKLYPCLYQQHNKDNHNEHMVTCLLNHMNISISLDLISQREPTPRIIYVLQRRQLYNPDAFLSANSPQLFGMPIPLFVYPDFVTGIELYSYLRRHFHRIIMSPLQKSVLSNISPDDKDMSSYYNAYYSQAASSYSPNTITINKRMSTSRSFFDYMNNSSFADIYDGNKEGKNINSNINIEENYEFGSVPTNSKSKEEYINQIYKKYGFVLRLVDNRGISCSQCHWLKGCQGCYIYPNNDHLYSLNALRKIALDWNPQLLSAHKNILLYENILTHKSVEDINTINKLSVTLNECFERFTKTEILYRDLYIKCPICKCITNHYLATSFYRLPPILIIHLKRFHCNKKSKRKLETRVEFPLRDFDLNDFVVQDIHQTDEADLTWWEYLGGKYNGNSPVYECKPKEEERDDDDDSINGSNDDVYENSVNDTDDGLSGFEPIDFSTLQATINSTIHEHHDEESNDRYSDANDREPLDSDYGAEKDSGELSHLMQDRGESPISMDRSPCKKYDLYGVINHKGTLQEGHYTATVLASDNQWYLINDGKYTSIKLNNVCTRSAYILFYVRQDVESSSVQDFFKVSKEFADLTRKEDETEQPESKSDKKKKDKKKCCII
ncbi:hypothetical protein WA158_003882 [Blastocystis sp. Blastoise]